MTPRFDEASLRAYARRFGTPLYVTDIDTVLARAGALAAFDVVRYAQKANGVLPLLRALARAGTAVDAVSAGEIARALAAGFAPERTQFTADLFTRESLGLVVEHGLRANLGSSDMIEQLAAASPGHEVALRVNPGFGHGHGLRVAAGGPASKHGIWHEEVGSALERCARSGLVVRGLHVHVGSGAVPAVDRMVRALSDLVARFPATTDTVSIGGGLPVPYREDELPFDAAGYARTWMEVKTSWERELRRDLTLEVEPGRFLVAPAAVLLCEVRATKRTSDYEWVIVDAGFHTLLRPALYGAYHRITALHETGALHEIGEPRRPQVVAGPLCEPDDVFTQDADGHPRPIALPELEPGDVLCIHDVGAYGSSMASNYNTMPHPLELVIEGGEPVIARPRQAWDELWS